MKGKVAILGAGAFGLALGKNAADRGYSTILWARDNDVVNSINNFGFHSKKLSNIKLPPLLKAATDLKTALSAADFVVVTVPMTSLAAVLSLASEFFERSSIIISATKGIESSSLQFPSNMFARLCATEIQENVAFLSGPSFALEVAVGLPTAVTLASKNRETAIRAQVFLSSEVFRVYVTDDVLGVEIGGALKNVIAIAAGMANGLGLGYNAQASLITRGLAEMTRLAVKMGASSNTLSGLSGMGDLILTCNGDLSRNRRVGIKLASGDTIDNIVRELGETAEGVNTALSIPALSQKYDVDLPIGEAVFEVLFNHKSPNDMLHNLMTRRLKSEWV